MHRFRVGGNMVVSRTNYEITNEPHARRVGYRDWGYGGLQLGSFEVVRVGALWYTQQCKLGS